MLARREQPDHFMIGQTVETSSGQGEIENVIEHEWEDEDGYRHTHKRIIVDTGDRKVNCSTSDVEVVR